MSEKIFVVSSSRFSFRYGGEDIPLLTFSGIDVQAKTSGHKLPIASGRDGKTVRQTVSTGYYGNQNVTIEATMTHGDMKLYNFFKQGLPASYKGEGKWSGSFKDAAIDVLGPDRTKKPILTYNLKQCQIVSYEIGECNVNGEDFLTEKFELNVESVERKQ